MVFYKYRGCCIFLMAFMGEMAVLLNKSDMAASLGVSVQAFDKYGITPVERRGREVFYDVKSVVEYRVARELQKAREGQSGDGENDYEKSYSSPDGN